MARTCTICTHHYRDSVHKALLRGEQLKTVARRYDVSDDALGRDPDIPILKQAKAEYAKLQ